MNYTELHCHSAFSFLDGVSLPDELVARALELGYDALALTDHNSVSGSMEFAVAAQALGLRAIHGAELDLDGGRPDGGRPGRAGGRHITLLVEDARGWSNLCRILTRAHAHTREGRAGAPPAEPSTPLRMVLEHSEGLVCLSGCARQGIHDEPTLLRLREAYGSERLRVELQRPFLRDDCARNRRLQLLARRIGVPCVATGDVHAHARSRAPLQDAFVAVRLHTTLDGSEPQRRGNHSHVLAAPGEMAARFPDCPEAVAETARLSERLRFDLRSDLGYRYPGSEDPEAMHKLAGLCRARLEQRYGQAPAGVRARAQSRLDEELRIIDSLGLAGFFLLHHDLLELAREVAVEVRGPQSARTLLPPGRGRGSSVSSIVCYLTGLSHVDPIANQLLIGRFLNDELTALPDIDLDFPRDIREALIPRIHDRYGRERSALVAAFPTYRARGAIRELGKALGLPAGEIERVARASEGWDAREVARDIESALLRKPSGRWAWLARLAAEAHGLPRHLSQHSGGMIVSTRPLIDSCAIVPAAMEGRQIVHWDKDSCADAGFLKIDLLGLGMLSAVERCIELIASQRGERIDLSQIPYDDPLTYECIQNADTTGVFQIESRAQMQSLRRTRPESLEDLTIQVAIVRPGPIQGGAVNPYIARRQRLREDPNYRVPYEHPSLEPVLRQTLGTIIFQDQVLEVATAFAGFSPGEAEGLRRAMSRKRSEAAIEAYHDRFVDGAWRLHGVEQESAERVFAMIEGFSGFGFPKAHGAAFGLLAYQSTWLRVHYGPEFLCSVLNEQPMGFYPPDALVHEAQRRGIEVRAPDINSSAAECELEPDGAVRIGLGYVKGVREREVEALVASRVAGGRFRSLADLASRAGAGAPALELLAWAGACDSLAGGDGPPSPAVDSAARASSPEGSAARASSPEGSAARASSPEGSAARASSPSARRIALWQLGVAAPGRPVPGGVQLALPLEVPAPPRLREFSGWEAMAADYATSGLTVKAHPLALLRDGLPSDAVGSRELEQLAHGARVKVAGLVVARQRPGTAGGIVFVLLEDEHGTINLVIPARVYERHRLTVRTEPLMIVEGKLEHLAAAGGSINVLVDTVAPIALQADDSRVARISEAGCRAGARRKRPLVEVRDFSLLDEQVRRGLAEQRGGGPSREPAADDRAGDAPPALDDFRAVAPPVLSFASGRRR
jgi:error-prone DNA polymerase